MYVICAFYIDTKDQSPIASLLGKYLGISILLNTKSLNSQIIIIRPSVISLMISNLKVH